MSNVMTAHGEFDVKTTPQAPDGDAAGPFGRLLLDKNFHGDLEGTSKGQMLGSMSAVEGSGGYVALEMFTGTLRGKRGSFVLAHQGTMQGGVYNLRIVIVPDSGTGDLAGIAGTMTIAIDGGKHSYELTCKL